VGLTATMGVGRKQSTWPSTAVLQLCANLDAQTGIVTVRDPANKKELDKYIPQLKQGNCCCVFYTNQISTKYTTDTVTLSIWNFVTFCFSVKSSVGNFSPCFAIV